jgi:hypothetical protein
MEVNMKNTIWAVLFIFLGLGTAVPAFAEEGAEATSVRAPYTDNPSKLKADLKTGTGIDKSEPTGVADSFPVNTDQVVGWSRITGAAEPTEISHVWIFNGKEQSTVYLNVKSSSFRTYSRKSIRGQAGKWTLAVRDAAGQLISSKDFEVTP